MTPSPEIVLASTSPRRKEILSLLGLPFKIVSPPFEEIFTETRSAAEEAASFAEGKARSVVKKFPRSILIGSDTLIDCEGGKIGKPRDREDAKEILGRLQGRPHRIWTAVALIDPMSASIRIETEEVKIVMREMNPREIENYVATEEPLDKAGAYSLQGKGRRFIAKLEGDYLAAVGLPLRPIAALLKENGISIPIDIEQLYKAKSFLNWKSFHTNPG
jgi:septum formation protein